MFDTNFIICTHKWVGQSFGQVEPAKFIILNVKNSLVFNTKIIIFDRKFIIYPYLVQNSAPFLAFFGADTTQPFTSEIPVPADGKQRLSVGTTRFYRFEPASERQVQCRSRQVFIARDFSGTTRFSMGNQDSSTWIHRHAAENGTRATGQALTPRQRCTQNSAR